MSPDASSDEDQLALYLDYWERCGVTIIDPDGWRLALNRRTWDT